MDVLKKMFSKGKENEKPDDKFKDEFRKPTWFEEYETDDDELFDSNRKFVYQMFTNPMELQKHFEQQMQDILKSIREFEENGENIDRNLKDEYLKPGFEDKIMKEFEKNVKSMDTDLDSEIYSDQLHSLLQRLSPDIKSNAQPTNMKKQILLRKQQKPKLSDEETIMGRIHGTLDMDDDNTPSPAVRRKEVIVPKIPPHFGGVFDGTYQGPKIFRQSIMTQTIRKPDGTYETKKIIRDTDGNIKTTITRTNADGKKETITTYGKENENNNGNQNTNTHNQQLTVPSSGGIIKNNNSSNSSIIKNNSTKAITDNSIITALTNRNIYVSRDGYALPRNLW